MDPTATWAELLRAYRASHSPACRQASRDLLAWRTRGGLPPVISGIPPLDSIMARAVCAGHVFWDAEGEADDED